MLHQKHCAWLKARKELCHCEFIPDAKESPEAQLARAKQEILEWKARHGLMISEIIKRGYGNQLAFDIAEAAHECYKKQYGVDISEFL